MPRKSSNLLKRRLKIAEIVGQQGEIKVEDLSAQLGVSGVTIRGDLSYLEQQGYLKRSFGGAIATPSQPQQMTSEPVLTLPSLRLANQLEIARHCARMITDRDTVFLGHGDICRKVIPFLSGLKKLRLIVNDLQHAMLADQFVDGEIIVAGGELIRSQLVLSGKALDTVIQQFTINHCILQASITDGSGILNIDPPLLASHYQRCMDKAQNKTAILTHVPIQASAIGTLGHLSQVDNLVTNRSVNEHYQQQLFESDFSIRYTNNECFTWANRETIGE
ncbi:DeoR faimly transcriptional regulator [Chania multitudinisentens RB-25]|uniref:DeoR faimly transcriptional regulator n=1 Tax=Chania multitudinisentens RB-25 TaxID=1441930 RepID=W0LBQ0_9GAMM|nr:DeoR/GlpR family DNA-binding transcription regulator [Chania multitudinisentens]AHG19824.1 DeoR faimly transcriptional regulator [Chania multitudinisentens RB-25]